MSGTSSASTPAVSLRGIRKRFGYRDVLRGIDLEIPAGVCAAIFGANGAGKSTLLRIVATLAQPSEGVGSVLGFDLVRRPLEVRRRIGVVMHQSFLRDELTLDENLRLFAALYGSVDGMTGETLVERFGLAHRRRDPVGTFSQGMTKRANLIRSLLHAPQLWILDEPFSGLDPAGQELLRESIHEFRTRGGTVLLVTHRTDLGRELAQQVVSIHDGDIVAAGTPGELP